MILIGYDVLEEILKISPFINLKIISLHDYIQEEIIR